MLYRLQIVLEPITVGFFTAVLATVLYSTAALLLLIAVSLVHCKNSRVTSTTYGYLSWKSFCFAFFL